MQRREPRLPMVALGAIPIIMLLLGYLLWGEFQSSNALRQEVDRSYESRLRIEQILSMHQDIETGQRGYVLTGSENFLQPYFAALKRVDMLFAELQRKGQWDSELDGEIAALRRLSIAQRAFASEMVALRRAGRTGDAASQIASGRGKMIMDAIRRHIHAMHEKERRRLEASVARFEAARVRAQRVTFALLAALGLLLLAAGWSNRRSMRGRREAMKRLEDVSARQAAILNGVYDGVVTINESGSIEGLNPAAARMFGYAPEELVRRDVGRLFEIAPDQDRDEPFVARMQRRRATDLGHVREFTGRRRDGSLFPTDVALSEVQLPDGMRYVAVIRDATERKQVEQMKSEFVSTVSHELRTPLTSIAGSLGLLAGGASGALPQAAQRLITIAHTNSQRLVRLINDILDIEKIESGKMDFQLAPIGLAGLLDQAVQANRGFADEHEVAIILKPPPAGAAIFADNDRMMQVLTNLLSNAIKFSPHGGAVRVSVKRLDRRFRISIADKGPGISEEFRARIFSKFAQADSTDTRQKGGTGLGLSIVREIVTRLGGSISFDSAEGRGTTFHVDLPSADRAADLAQAAEVRPIEAGAEPMLLHVEDDPDMLRLVASAFDGKARVFSTPSVEEAHAALQRFAFDAVVLDIGMADGSGLDLLPAIRGGGRKVPVVVFTAQDSDGAVKAKVDSVLVKSRASLERLVETTMDLIAPSNAAGEKKR